MSKVSCASKNCPTSSASYHRVITTFSGKIMLGSMRILGVVLLLVVSCGPVSGNRSFWEAPGCHLVGHTRTVKIPGCVQFEVTTHGCRGFCLSYAVPSPAQTLAFNRNQVITSKAKCCGMVETHEVHYVVRCQDGFQNKTFKSATSCDCSICRRTQ